MIFLSSRNCLWSDSDLSQEKPITCNPLAPYFFWRLLKPGSSPRQGGHHEAQKSIMSTLPLYISELTSLPKQSTAWNFGIGLWIFELKAWLWAGVLIKTNSTAQANRIDKIFFMFISLLQKGIFIIYHDIICGNAFSSQIRK